MATKIFFGWGSAFHLRVVRPPGRLARLTYRSGVVFHTFANFCAFASRPEEGIV
jgi:hypothetical protein